MVFHKLLEKVHRFSWDSLGIKIYFSPVQLHLHKRLRHFKVVEFTVFVTSFPKKVRPTTTPISCVVDRNKHEKCAEETEAEPKHRR